MPPKKDRAKVIHVTELCIRVRKDGLAVASTLENELIFEDVISEVLFSESSGAGSNLRPFSIWGIASFGQRPLAERRAKVEHTPSELRFSRSSAEFFAHLRKIFQKLPGK